MPQGPKIPPNRGLERRNDWYWRLHYVAIELPPFLKKREHSLLLGKTLWREIGRQSRIAQAIMRIRSYANKRHGGGSSRSELDKLDYESEYG